MDKWTITTDSEALDKALTLARGTYQRAFLRGLENLSGSSLKGKARSYGGHYKRSREALLKRMTQAGVPWCEVKAERGARVLVIGSRDYA